MSDGDAYKVLNRPLRMKAGVSFVVHALGCLFASQTVAGMARLRTWKGPDQVDVDLKPGAPAGRRLLADSTTTIGILLHPTQEEAQQVQKRVETLAQPSNADQLVQALQDAGLPVTKAAVSTPVTFAWKPVDLPPVAPAPAPESKGITTSAGIGIAVGVLLVLSLVGALAWWYIQRRKNQEYIKKATAARNKKGQELAKGKSTAKISLGSIEESDEAQSPSESSKTPGSMSGGAPEVRSKDKVARALHYGPDGELHSEALEDVRYAGPSRNTTNIATPVGKMLDQGRSPSSGGSSSARRTPGDLDDVEREHKRLMLEAQRQKEIAEAASRTAEKERQRAEEKESRLAAAQAHAISLEEKILQLEKQAAQAAARISPSGSPRATRISESEFKTSRRNSEAGTSGSTGVATPPKPGKPKERLAQLEAEEQQLEVALAATHQDLANTSARLRAVEAELEQAEAEAALHRSAAEHAAAIAEKYAEERDSSRAEMERLKLEALQREQDMQRRLDEAVVEAQQAAARARALTEEREALRNLLKALRTDQAKSDRR